MYYLRDILRLYTGKYSIKEIANMYNISQQTVLNYINLFNKHGLSWPLSDEFANDQVLAEKLELKKSMPISLDFEIISNKTKHITLLKNGNVVTQIGENNWSWVGILSGNVADVLEDIKKIQIVTNDGVFDACY